MEKVKLTDSQVDTMIQNLKPQIKAILNKRSKGDKSSLIFDIDKLIGMRLGTNQTFRLDDNQLEKIQEELNMVACLSDETHHKPFYYIFHSMRYSKIIFNPDIDYLQHLEFERKTFIIIALGSLIMGLGIIGVMLATHLISHLALITLWAMHHMANSYNLKLRLLWLPIMGILLFIPIALVLFFLSMTKVFQIYKKLNELPNEG